MSSVRKKSKKQILEEYSRATTMLAWVIGRMANEDSKSKRDALAAQAIGIFFELEPIEKEQIEYGDVSKTADRSLSL